MLLSFLTLFGCAVEVLQVPIARQDTSPIYRQDRPLYVGSLDVLAFRDPILIRAWKLSLASVIKSKRIFRDVQLLPGKKSEMNGDFYIIDVTVKPEFKTRFNWIATFPAVFPFTGYWPVQIKKGSYSVRLAFTIKDKSDKMIFSKSIIFHESEKVHLYGFYRTSRFEDMIERTNLEVMESCASSIESFFIH